VRMSSRGVAQPLSLDWDVSVAMAGFT